MFPFLVQQNTLPTQASAFYLLTDIINNKNAHPSDRHFLITRY